VFPHRRSSRIGRLQSVLPASSMRPRVGVHGPRAVVSNHRGLPQPAHDHSSFLTAFLDSCFPLPSPPYAHPGRACMTYSLKPSCLLGAGSIRRDERCSPVLRGRGTGTSPPHRTCCHVCTNQTVPVPPLTPGFLPLLRANGWAHFVLRCAVLCGLPPPSSACGRFTVVKTARRS